VKKLNCELPYLLELNAAPIIARHTIACQT
jgi:hypothetical protein